MEKTTLIFLILILIISFVTGMGVIYNQTIIYNLLKEIKNKLDGVTK